LTRLLVPCVLAVLVVAGCTVDRTDEPTEREWDSWDLTSPPTRAEVGMAEGRTTVIYQTSPADSQPVTVRLPGDRVLQSQANSVSFSALGAPEPTQDDPTTMDIGSALLPLDEALSEMSAALRTLGLPTAEAKEWYRSAAAASGGDRIESPWLRASVGYLTVSVQGRYSALDRTAVVSYVLTW